MKYTSVFSVNNFTVSQVRKHTPVYTWCLLPESDDSISKASWRDCGFPKTSAFNTTKVSAVINISLSDICLLYANDLRSANSAGISDALTKPSTSSEASTSTTSTSNPNIDINCFLRGDFDANNSLWLNNLSIN